MRRDFTSASEVRYAQLPCARQASLAQRSQPFVGIWWLVHLSGWEVLQQRGPEGDTMRRIGNGLANLLGGLLEMY
jgi:hypothetical protein